MAVLSSSSLIQATERLNNLRRAKPEEKWRIETYNLLQDLIDTTFDMQQFIKKTQFDERLIVSKRPQFSLLPQANDIIRNIVTETSGSTQTYTSGEIRLRSGADPEGYVSIQTRERGEYVAGAEIECGVGIRVPGGTSSFEPGQSLKWGYYDSENGYGWKLNNDTLATFVRKNGVDTFTSQSQFSEDVLDSTGPSGDLINLETGSVYVINFAWYGYGDDVWSLARTRLNDGGSMNRFPSVQELHRVRYHVGGASVEQPNLPINIELDNGGVSDNSVDAYIGGRQVSVLSEVAGSRRRSVVEVIERHILTGSNNTFEPIIALRPAETFRGQLNGINIRFKGITVTPTGAGSTRVTIGDDLTGTTWSTPTGYDSTTTAAEISKTSDISVSGVGPKIPPYIRFEAGNRTEVPSSIDDERNYVLGLGGTILVWAKLDDIAADRITVSLEWTESF